MSLPPVLQALVLADHVYIDAASGKKVIAGTFNHLTVARFPTMLQASKFAFLAVTSVHGKLPLSMRWVPLNDNQPLVELSSIEVEANNPLETVEVVVELPPLPLPHPGAYIFEVLSAGAVVGALRVLIDAGPEGDTGQPTDGDDAQHEEEN